MASCSNNECVNRVDQDSSAGIAKFYGLGGRGFNHIPHLARRLDKEWSSNSFPSLHRQGRL